jgi:hypothetical protein
VSGNWRVTFVFVGSDVDQVNYEDWRAANVGLLVIGPYHIPSLPTRVGERT